MVSAKREWTRTPVITRVTASTRKMVRGIFKPGGGMRIRCRIGGIAQGGGMFQGKVGGDPGHHAAQDQKQEHGCAGHENQSLSPIAN
jgi:hypothetical protein